MTADVLLVAIDRALSDNGATHPSPARAEDDHRLQSASPGASFQNSNNSSNSSTNSHRAIAPDNDGDAAVLAGRDAIEVAIAQLVRNISAALEGCNSGASSGDMNDNDNDFKKVNVEHKERVQQVLNANKPLAVGNQLDILAHVQTVNSSFFRDEDTDDSQLVTHNDQSIDSTDDSDNEEMASIAEDTSDSSSASFTTELFSIASLEYLRKYNLLPVQKKTDNENIRVPLGKKPDIQANKPSEFGYNGHHQHDFEKPQYHQQHPHQQRKSPAHQSHPRYSTKQILDISKLKKLPKLS